MMIEPKQYEAEMWEKVDGVNRAQQAVLDAQAALEAARDDAERAMSAYGAALSIADQSVDRGTIHRLYWGHRHLRVKGIARAFGFRAASVVHSFAGPGEVTESCPGGCGRVVTLRARTSPAQLCEACAAEREAEHAASSAARAESYERNKEELRDRMRAGATADQLLVERTERWEVGNPVKMYRQLYAEVLAEGALRPLP